MKSAASFVAIVLSLFLTARSFAEEEVLDFGDIREEHVMVPMRDSVKLSVYLFTPEGKGPRPVIFEQRYASLRAKGTRESAITTNFSMNGSAIPPATTTQMIATDKPLSHWKARLVSKAKPSARSILCPGDSNFRMPVANGSGIA